LFKNRLQELFGPWGDRRVDPMVAPRYE